MGVNKMIANYYKVRVKETIEIEDRKGNVKEKVLNLTYLVEADSVTEAEALVTKFIGAGDFEVSAVKNEKLEAVVLKQEK